MKKKYEFANGKFASKCFTIRTSHVLIALLVIVIATLIYVNV